QAEDGIRDKLVTGVQTCALPILALIRTALPEIRANPGRCCRLRKNARRCRGERSSPPLVPAPVRAVSTAVRWNVASATTPLPPRSEERRVGKECRTRGRRKCGKK